MRVIKLAVATLVLGLLGGVANGATPSTIRPNLISTVSLPSASDDITQIIGSGNSWLVVGNVEKSAIPTSELFPSEVSLGDTDGYIAMLDPVLHLIWSHRFGTSLADVATSIALGGDGLIWTVGVTTKEVPAVPSSPPIAPITPSPPPLTPTTPIPTVNPDGVVPLATSTPPAVADQLLISSWSKTGQLLSQSLNLIADGISINPTAVVPDKSGVYVVGTGVDPSAGTSRGFYVHITRDGLLGPTRWIGTKAVVLRTAALLSNGSLAVAGSISETLKGKPSIGLVDALVVVVNPISGAVLRTLRSGFPSAFRSWESLSVDRFGNLVAIGPSRLGVKNEVVATSFSSSGAVKFSLHFANPVGTQASLLPPTGNSAFFALSSIRPGRGGREAFLAPLDSRGRVLSPTYLAGKAGTGLLAAARGHGYLLAVGDVSELTLSWFAPRSGK